MSYYEQFKDGACWKPDYAPSHHFSDVGKSVKANLQLGCLCSFKLMFHFNFVSSSSCHFLRNTCVEIFPLIRHRQEA